MRVLDQTQRLPTRVPWQKVRIGLLLLILLFVSGETYLKQLDATAWVQTLTVVVYPVNGDGSPAAARYIQSLNAETFASIERFMQRQAHFYGMHRLKPFQFRVSDTVESPPPRRPGQDGVLANVWYSLRLRLWAWLNEAEGAPADIRMYVVYYDPMLTTRVPDSLGLSKGMFGVVHAYADRDFQETNNVVIAHEMLHTLGATDKYDPVTNLPVYPEGYAQPYQAALYPQKKAELMGGRIPLSAAHADMPASLDDAVIGGQTALEIKWIR